MAENRPNKKKNKPRRFYDYSLLFTVIFLTVFGLVMIYSSSSYAAQIKYDDAAYFMMRQAKIALAGFVIMLIISKMDYHWYARFAVLAYVLSYVLMIATALFGIERNGKKRWLGVGGASIQPTEFVKIALIVMLASMIVQMGKNINEKRGVVLVIVTTLPIAGIVAANNLSSGIIIAGIAFVMLFVACKKKWPFFACGFAGVGVLAFADNDVDRAQRGIIFIDYDEMERIAIENKPKLIIAGASAYGRTIDFKRFREVADKVGAYLMVDMAHIAGLVAAGLHPSPIPYADVVTTTTHKTLRGPRGGMILANKEAAEKFNFNKAIFPGTQGGPLEHVIAGKAVCFGEALKPEFKEYQEQVVKNAKALAAALVKQGFNILTGGTDNHLMLIDLRGMEVTGKELQNRCDEVYLTLNKNAVPNDPRSPFVTSGVRVGTPAVTSRGLKEEDMEKIAECIWLAATDFENKADYIRAEVTKICEKYPIYE